MTSKLPEDCPMNASATQSIRIPTKFSISDALKIAGIIAALAAGWFRLEKGLDELRTSQAFDRERMTRIENANATATADLKSRLDRIDDKLDRLIEHRGGR